MKQLFRSSRRDLLKFLTAGGAAGVAVAKTVEQLPEPASGIVLASPEDIQQFGREREMSPFPGRGWPDPSRPHAFDVVPWVLYERIELLGDHKLPQVLPCFQEPISLRRSPLQTNMQLGGCLPAPNHFAVQQLYILIDPQADPLTVAQFLSGTTYRLHHMGKMYGDGLCLAIGRIGMLGDVAVTFEDFTPQWENLRSQIGRKHSERRGEFGVDYNRIGYLTLLPQAYFGVDLYPETAQARHPEGTATMWVCLDGLLARGVL